MDSESSVMRSARSFFAGTLLSRIMGMVRDVSMAFCFGSAPEVAAFMVAYRLANLFRRLLGEGNLQGGFVPHFEKLRLESEEKAARFYRDIYFSLIILTAGIVVIGGIVCYFLAHVLASDIPLMIVAMLPGVIFLCLYALNSSVLQCQQRYFLPAFAPVAFNACWVLLAIFLRGKVLRDAMFSLSFGVMAAFFLQWYMTSPPLTRWFRGIAGRREWFSFQLFSSDVRSLLKPISYGIVGIGAAQINVALDAIFARIADPSGPAYLWYAIRIQQLPLALFGIALAGALLPPLSRAMQSGAIQRYQELLQGGIKQSAALIIPCALGMFVLASPGLDLLYGHGGFHRGDVAETTICLQAYAIGLVPMVYVLLLANGFYAQKEYSWPMRSSLAAVVCNAILNIIFVFVCHWGAVSIAIATTISAFVNCSMLIFGLQKQVGEILLWKGNVRVIVCSLSAAIVAFFVDQMLPHHRNFASQVSRFVMTTGSFGAIVFGLAYLLNVREILNLLHGKKGLAKDTGEA